MGKGWEKKLDSKLAALVGQLNRSSDWAEVPEVVMLAFIEVTDLFREQTIALKDLQAEVKALRSAAASSDANGFSDGDLPSSVPSPSNKDGMLDKLSALQKESHDRHRRTRSRATDANSSKNPTGGNAASATALTEAAAGGIKAPGHTRDDSSDSVIRTGEASMAEDAAEAILDSAGGGSGASKSARGHRSHTRAPSVKELANVFEKIAVPVKMSHPQDKGDEDDLIFSPSPSPCVGRAHFPAEGESAKKSKEKNTAKNKSKGVRFAEEPNVNVFSVNLADFESKAGGNAGDPGSQGARAGSTNHEIIFVFEGDEDSPGSPEPSTSSMELGQGSPSTSNSPRASALKGSDGTAKKKKKKNVKFTMEEDHVVLYDHEAAQEAPSEKAEKNRGVHQASNGGDDLIPLDPSGIPTSSLDSILADIEQAERAEDDHSDGGVSADDSPATTASPGSDTGKLDSLSAPPPLPSPKKKGKRLLKVFMRRKRDSDKGDDESHQEEGGGDEETMVDQPVSAELAMLIDMLANT